MKLYVDERVRVVEVQAHQNIQNQFKAQTAAVHVQ